MQKGFDTLADLIRETNDKLDTIRTELGKQIAATNGRLDNLIVIAGEQTRGLRQDVDALKARMDALVRPSEQWPMR